VEHVASKLVLIVAFGSMSNNISLNIGSSSRITTEIIGIGYCIILKIMLIIHIAKQMETITF
jgi:hypothetical protein